MAEPYELSARLYDRIYSAKRYQDEAAGIRSLVARLNPKASTLLEVACGTGGHLAFLKAWFEVEGVDLSTAMLDVARAKLAGVPLHQGDMRAFSSRGVSTWSLAFSAASVT